MTNATVDLNGAWKIHTPNLFKEVMNNHGAWALAAPLRILSQKLAEVAARAIVLGDKELLKLCCDLTLLEESDPQSPNYNPEMVEALSAEGELQKYIVSGRVMDESDDTVKVVEASSIEKAEEIFVEYLRKECDGDENTEIYVIYSELLNVATNQCLVE